MDSIKYKKLLELCSIKYYDLSLEVSKLKKKDVVKEYLNLKNKIIFIELSYNHVKNQYYENKESIELVIRLKEKIDLYLKKCQEINQRLTVLEDIDIIKQYNKLTQMLRLLDKIKYELNNGDITKVLNI